MEKYNLSVAVMQDDEPIMFIYSLDTYFNEGGRVFGVLRQLFPCLDFHLIKGEDTKETNYCEYSCSPDREREDMELLAIWQKLED